MYKQYKDIISNVICAIIFEDANVHSFGFDPANTDYQKFKADVLAGTELQDAEGNVLSQADAEAFIKTLP